MAIFRAIFEATQFQSNLLQQNSKNVEAIFSYGQLLQKMVKYGCENRAFRDRVWSNFAFSLIASTSQDKIGSIGLDLPPFASAPGYPYYLQSRTCGYNHELFPVVFINVEISTFHFLTLWKCADIQPSFKQKQGFSRVLPGFSLYFHKAVFAHALKPLVHKGLRWWLDIISTFSWLLPAGTERGEAAGAECGETLLCPTALFI